MFYSFAFQFDASFFKNNAKERNRNIGLYGYGPLDQRETVEQ